MKSVIDEVLAEEDRQDGPLLKGIAELVTAVEKQNLQPTFPVSIPGGFELMFKFPESFAEHRKFLIDSFEFARDWMKRIEEKAIPKMHREALVFAGVIDAKCKPVRPDSLIEDFVFIHTLMARSAKNDKITQIQATRLLRNSILCTTIVNQIDKNDADALLGLEWAGYAGKKKDTKTTSRIGSGKKSA